MTMTPTPRSEAPYILDPTRRGKVLLPPSDTFQIFLVGTGGTGSHLALALARLAWHARQVNKTVNLTFVDPDIVEAKNVGRQLFAPAEIGAFKAETLALRLNAAFGLDIHVIAEPLTPTLLPLDAHYYGNRYRHETLVIGAVDNHLARQAIATTVTQHRTWWLDMGNEQYSGRLYIGNVAEKNQLAALVQLNEFGLCTGLPLPSLQDPGLLESPPPDLSALSCADLTAREEQSLMVNQMIAALAAQYVSDFVLARSLAIFRSTFSLQPPMVHSLTISDQTLATLRADCLPA